MSTPYREKQSEAPVKVPATGPTAGSAALLASVVRERIENVIHGSGGDRVVYAVVDLGRRLTSAIARDIAAISPEHGRVEVAIHPSLAEPDLVERGLASLDMATRFRNLRDPETVATVFSVPGRQVESVIQSLGSVQRINGAWICDPSKADIWTDKTIHGYSETITAQLTDVLKGIMESDILTSAEMLAEFCAGLQQNMLGSDGLPLPKAVNDALPCLHLPRNSMPPMSPERLAKTAATQFKKLRDDLQPYLYLNSRKGELRSLREMKNRLKLLEDNGSIKTEYLEALADLIEDHDVTAGAWQHTQQCVAEISWSEVQKFFEGSSARPTGHIGVETIEFLDAEHPGVLEKGERETLVNMRRGTGRSSSAFSELFERHGERLRSNPKLFKKWQVLIFDRPVEETGDLLVGLIRLAEKAYQRAGENIDSILLVRLRGSEKRSFWRKDKNWYLCTFVRDRYRGLPELMKPDIELDFGRCWESSILDGIEDRKETGSVSATFEFEAHVVNRDDLDKIRTDRRLLARQHRAQLIWKPGHLSFASALSEDLQRVLPEGSDFAGMARSNVTPARGTRGAAVVRPTLYAKSSVTDSLGETSGSLVKGDSDSSLPNSGRIDQSWLSDFREHAKGTVPDSDRAEVERLFSEFHRQYSNAIAGMIRPRGAGLYDPSVITQAQCYGALLAKLRMSARTDLLVRKLWTPLLQIGTAAVEGDAPALLVAPWHPLRLLEFAAKAQQATQVIRRVMNGSAVQSVSIADYVRDRVHALRQSYYLDVGFVRTDGSSQLLVETETHAGYSLLQPPLLQSDDRLVEVPVKDAVVRFGEIAGQYLQQRPHERANFSTVLLDAEAEDLPVMVAKHLAKEIDNQPYLRCDLTVAHENPHKLRQIYERQNRRIGHEIESSLTSEAARIFMSRLRVGIAPTASLERTKGVKGQDIVLLHDVIARYARLEWDKVAAPTNPEDLRDHAPNDTSRRKSPVQGSLTSSVYLTAPLQVQPSQAYLDVLHDALRGKPSPSEEHYVPSQGIDLLSTDIARKLEIAHTMAHWVVTYDRIADRRVLASANQGLRILRYYSTPRSLYNVIVSTEVKHEELRTRLKEELDRILPDYDPETLNSLVSTVQKQATDLAGGIVMRGRHWDNYARELIGVVVAQRELGLLLASLGESRTAMFYLDEFKNWLDLTGEIADILAVSLHVDGNGPAVRLVVAEAKCVNEAALHESRKKSWVQLKATYDALTGRFATDESAIDPSVWRNRLADMLVEHMTPWGEQERLGGKNFDQWIDLIRGGEFSVDVSGHSIVSVHDLPESEDDLDLFTAEVEGETPRLRKLARWTLGADCIKRTIRYVASTDAKPLLHIPAAWPDGPCEEEKDSNPTPDTDDIRPPEPEPDAQGAQSGDALESGTKGTGNGSPVDGTSTEADHGKDRNSGPPESGSGKETAPERWKRAVYETVAGMSKVEDERHGREWLNDQVGMLKQALQAENKEARIEGSRLTPNAGLVRVDGRVVTVKWLSGKQTDLLTRYGIDIVRITPQPGRIAVAIRRPKRAILHLAEAWKRRALQPSSPETNMAVVIGEQEDDGELFYLSFNEDFERSERAAPHTLVSGTTGSGKGILTSNLILDLCAFNHPRSVEIYLIDPKHGADYLWARSLPHLRGGIVAEKEEAIALLRRLVRTMEERYDRITGDECANIDQYNRKRDSSDQLPRVVIFFDEVANWMQDDEFKHDVESVINEIATKSRAAGLHLFMIYQRADNQVMTMQLRTNLGNRLILRLGDEGSSKIALGDKGAERLLGKGHIIAKLGNDEKIYGQVPFIGEDEIAKVAGAIKKAWEEPQE